MKLWIARDKDRSTIWMFFDKPKLNKDTWLWKGTKLYCGAMSPGLDKHKEIFPELTFENSPQEVELKLVSEIIGVAESPSKTFPRVNEFETGASYRR